MFNNICFSKPAVINQFKCDIKLGGGGGGGAGRFRPHLAIAIATEVITKFSPSTRSAEF